MSTALIPAERQEAAGYVLVVAADVFIRKLCRRQLEEMGLPVQEALSVARGLGRVRMAEPLLVLLDPWVDRGAGLGFLEEVQEQSGQIRVLLVGAEPRAESLRRAVEMGALGHITVDRLGSIGEWVDAALTEK
jgi:DNA-binding NtrC family response regulator